MSLKEYLISDTSPASNTTSFSTVTATGLDQFDWFTIDAALLGATGGVLDVYLQRWSAQLQEWRDWLRFAQLAAGAAAVRYTFDSNTAPSTGITTVGQGASPAIAAGALVCAHPGTKLRAFYSAGAGTSAGAAQKIAITGWRRR